MKEYILNIKYENWENQLWFMNEDNDETKEQWNNAIKNIELLKIDCKEPIEFQDKIIEYLKRIGFVRIQK